MIDNLIVDEHYKYEGNGFSHKLPTGIVTLDLALAGGIPLDGSIIELYGEESHGKTTMAYRICKRCTESEEGYVTWIDSELSYDKDWAGVQGLDTNKIIAYRPPHMEASINLIIEDVKRYRDYYLPWISNPEWKPTQEQADAAGVGIRSTEDIKEYMRSVAPPHIIVWDSLAASPVKSVAEDGGSFSDGMAYRARLIKMFLSRYEVAAIGCEKIGMILINQVIDKIGSYTGGVTTPGGRGLRHGKHLSIMMKKYGNGEKDSDSFKTTDYCYIAITKNKVTPIIASLPVIFSKSRGFLGATSIYEYLNGINWFTGKGAWVSFLYETVNQDTGEIVTEDIKFQKSKFYDLLEKRPELFEYLCNKILSRYIEKFPFSSTLKSTDVSSIVRTCMAESTFTPDESELDSISEEY